MALRIEQIDLDIEHRRQLESIALEKGITLNALLDEMIGDLLAQTRAKYRYIGNDIENNLSTRLQSQPSSNGSSLQ